MNICLFYQNELNSPLPKKDERAQHIVKVLHKKAGDSFDAGIIGGKSGKATITKIDEDGNIFFDFEPLGNGKELYPLTLIIGFPRPIQLKRLLRDVAGLGAEKVILTGTELTEKSYLDSNVVADGSAYRMLLDGTVQAASTHVPELVVRRTLADTLKSELSPSAPNVVRVALDNRRATMSLHDWLEKNFSGGTKPTAVIAAIGSERGWTENERDELENSGFTLCSLGKRILRTETAATVASSIILDKQGFLD